MSALVWLNGRLTLRDEATVSIDDMGFLYGAACFETMRAHGGVVFRLERHLDRLERGLDALGVAAPRREELRQAIAATLEANSLGDLAVAPFGARVRLTVSAGRGQGRPDLASPASPTVLITAEPRVEAPPAARLGIASHRLDEGRAMLGAKHANFLPQLLALLEARSAGLDDALLLNTRGHFAESAVSNVFVVIEDTLVAPPLEDGGLPGVTREAVLECARATGIAVGERSLTLDALRDAAEVLLTNSGYGVRGVATVEGYFDPPTADVPGPRTRSLVEAYETLVLQECGL